MIDRLIRALAKRRKGLHRSRAYNTKHGAWRVKYGPSGERKTRRMCHDTAQHFAEQLGNAEVIYDPPF